MKEGQFALIRGWRNVEVVEIGKVTPKLFKTKGDCWRSRQYRHGEALGVFTAKEVAEQVAQSLNGAIGERNRRDQAARADFNARLTAANDAYKSVEQKILAASGMEAPEGGETQSGSTEGDSPVGEAGDAQPQGDIS